MNKKRLVLIIVILLILAIAVTFTILYFVKRAKYVYDIKDVLNIEYNIINIDGKYGVIDGKGNVVIDPNYDVIQIPDPSQPIFVCMQNYNAETKEYQTKVLNDRKEQIITGYENVQAISIEAANDGVPFENTVLKYKKDGKYGLVDMEGKEITDPIYDEISGMMYKEGMLLVKQGEKVGIININGIEVIEPIYDNIAVDGYYDSNTRYKETGFIVCQIKENGYRYGYVDYRGDTILDTEYTEIERVTEIENEDAIYLVAYQDGQAGLFRNKKMILNHEYEEIVYYAYNDVFVVQRNGHQGITDRQGNIKIDTKYSNISFGGIYVNATENNEDKILDLNGNEVNDGYISKFPTNDGQHYIVYGLDGYYKIIDTDGNIVVDNNYTNIEEVGNNYFIVANDKNNGIIDLSGKSLVELKYNSIVKLGNTDLLQANMSTTSTISLINNNMQIVATMDNASIAVEDSYIRIYSNTENKYFDFNGNELQAKEVFPNNRLFAKKIGNKWGFVDYDGNLKVQNEYDMVTEFNEYGFAGIKLDDKWGVIDENGNIVVEPVYELENYSPMFIGKFYKADSWYGYDFYTDEINAEEN